MFSTLQAALGTWPSESAHRVNDENASADRSGLNERITFGSEDAHPTASSVFVLKPRNFPQERPFIPPYFIPPGRSIAEQRNDDVAERLQHALQQDDAASEAHEAPTPDYLQANIDPALQGLRRLAPKEIVVLEDAPLKPSRGPKSVPGSRSPSPLPYPTDLLREREMTWSDSAHQSFHAMIKAPGYVNRYRLDPAKYQRLLTYLRNSEVDPMNADGSKDHQTKYQAASWVLKDGKLYKKADSKRSGGTAGPRKHLDVDEVWDVLTAEHLRTAHLGRDRLRKVLEKRFIG